MSYFTDAQISTLVDAERVNVTSLVEFEFTSGIVRVSEEGVPFTDLNSNTWLAGHGLISYSDFMAQNKAAASKRTYRLSPTDGVLAATAVGMENEYRGQPVTQFLQFFAIVDVIGAGGALGATREPVGSPQFISKHIMDRASLSVIPGGAATLSLDCESLFAAKGRSTYGLVTQTDQRARFPDDAGLDRMPDLLRGKVVRWPDF